MTLLFGVWGGRRSLWASIVCMAALIPSSCGMLV